MFNSTDLEIRVVEIGRDVNYTDLEIRVADIGRAKVNSTDLEW